MVFFGFFKYLQIICFDIVRGKNSADIGHIIFGIPPYSFDNDDHDLSAKSHATEGCSILLQYGLNALGCCLESNTIWSRCLTTIIDFNLYTLNRKQVNYLSLR